MVRCSENGGIVAVTLPSEDYRTYGCWRDPLLAKIGRKLAYVF